MTFPALPPEINVGRLMSGAGPAPASAAAAAWSGVAAAISSRSAFLTSLLPRLAASWQAPETALMTKNVAMYLTHNETARVQAMLAATRHTKQAADYSAALVGMAQLPEIAANHVTHATLQATNFMGVNSAAIAANEARYASMWAQNAAMMAGYLANTVANMTFEPFLPPKPIATPTTVPIPAAAAGAASVGDAVVTKMTLAAQGAYAVASTLAMQASAGVLAGTKLGQTAAVNAQRVEHAATTAQNATSKADTHERKTAMTGANLGQALVQQIGGQVGQAAGSVGAAVAGQAAQQVGQQTVQVASVTGSQVVFQPLSQIVSTVSAENQSAAVGYFGARAGSPSLERIAKGERLISGASAVRGNDGKGSTASTSTPIVAPANWSTDGLAVAPPPPPIPQVAAEPLRPLQPVGSTAPVARSQGKQREGIPVPSTAAMPVYQDAAPELESVPVDAPAGGEEA